MKHKQQDNYKAWDIQAKNFPKNGSIEDKIRFLIGYGILAPSTHNTQPWLFEINSNQLTINPNIELKLPEADPSGRNLYISLGACLFNIQVAAKYFELNIEEKIITTGKNNAKIEMIFTLNSKDSDQLNSRLFEAIPNRYSEKRISEPVKISDSEWAKLKINPSRDTAISITKEKTKIHDLAQDVYKAAASYSKVPKFGRELAMWMRPNKTTSGDGMTGQVSGLTTGKVVVGKTLMKHMPKSMKIFAKKYLEQTIKSSALGLISTTHDEPKDWIESGKVYEELALKSTNFHISLGPMAALIETKYRSQLHTHFKDTKKFPQMFFRMIRVNTSTIHSPRRSEIQIKSTDKITIPAEFLKSSYVNKFMSLGKYRIHYIVAGEGQPIILLHGANTGWAQWFPNINHLAKEYRVYALDLPGSGQSTRFDYSQADFKKDYVDVVRKFIQKENLKNTYIIGHSFGAAIAAKLAISSPELVSEIVLVNPLGLIKKIPFKQRAIASRRFTRILTKTAVKPTRKNMKKFLQSAVYDKKIITEQFVDYYYDAVRQDKRSHPLLFMHGQTRGFKFNPDILYINQLKHIKIPILIILGKNDPLLPSKKIASLVRDDKNVKLKMFKETGHVTTLEQSNLFNKEVVNFFKDKK